MEEWIVENYSVFSICRFRERVFPSQTPIFSYRFHPGVYALTGQIDNGGWAFTYSLTPINDADVRMDGNSNIVLNKQPLSLQQLRAISHYLGQFDDSIGQLSADQLLRKFQKNGVISLTAGEIQEKFKLTEARWSRPLSATGNEIWRITAALGFVQKKKIFCFPWMTNRQLQSQLNTISYLGKVLSENNCYVLLPVENEDLVKEVVTDVIDLSYAQLY